MNLSALIFGPFATMAVVVGSAYIVGRQIKKLDAFIGVFNHLECDKRPKEDMVKCALKLWLFMFILGVVSSSVRFISFAVIPLWLGTAYILYRFFRVWKANGFPMHRLVLFTTTVLIISFSAGPLLKYGVDLL